MYRSVWLIVPLILSGCITPDPSPSARYYQLQPDPGLEATGTLPADATVLIGPLEISPYLDHPQLVRRPGPHEVAYQEFARWAEPLDRAIPAVLAANLRRLLGTDAVIAYSALTPAKGTYTVRIRVDRLEAEPGGKASLTALWSTQAPQETGIPPTKHARLEEDVGGTDLTEAVAAQSRLLAAFSRVLAEDLAALPVAGASE